MSRFPVGIVIAVTITIIAASQADAQTSADVDAARAELEQAEAQVAAALRIHTSLGEDLIAAIAHADAVRSRLAEVSYELIDLEVEVREEEAAASDAWELARADILTTYIAALEGSTSTVFVGDSILDGLLAGDLIAITTDHIDVDALRFDRTRHELTEGRAALEDARAEAQRLRSEAIAGADRLEELAALAADSLAAARAERVVTADAYDEAVTAYEALKNSVSRTVARWLPLLEQYFAPEQLADALEVMQCESNGIPTAVNASSQATGLFQFLPSTWAYSSVAAGFGGFEPTDPEANVASAAWLVDHSILIEHRLGPWGPWECNPALR